MSSVETTIITTALPTIVSELHGITQESWVFAMYLLTTAVTTPIYGKLADQLGRKPIFIFGLVTFLIGSIACGFSPNIIVLIVSRAIQGIGAGAIMPITFTIIADVFSFERRSNIMAMNNTAWGISALAGPLIGGFIVDKLNWHWVFFINVPLGILVLGLIVFGYHESSFNAKKIKIDYPGIVLLSASLIGLLLGLQNLSKQSTSFMFWLIPFITFAAALVFFIMVERRTEDPLIPLKLFSNRTFSIQITTALLLSGVQIGFQVYFPMWLQSIYHVSASIAGLAITPSPVLWLITSFFVGGLLKRFAPKYIVLPIVVIQTAFYVPLVFAGTNFPIMMFYVIAGITGAGLGIIITMNTVVAQELVPKGNIGTASSMLTLGRTLGQTVMTGIFGLVFNFALNQGVKANKSLTISKLNNAISSNTPFRNGHSLQNAINSVLLNGFHSVFMIAILLFVILIVLNLFDNTKEIIR